ncbi:MAG: putative transporter [Bacteroidales bacterium]|nr:putative transporter [Bacteroidales bacterium]
MEWLKDLFMVGGTAQSVLLIALTIATGIILNRIKLGHISLGSTWILFAGIIYSALGMEIDSNTNAFVKELGLILFVYSIGLQVGPGFFSSLKKEGLKLNLIAICTILAACLITFGINLISSDGLPVLTGVMSGAVTNTPSLGAAQQTYAGLASEAGDRIAVGYAVAYPMGVVGVIFVMVLIKALFKINIKKEEKANESGKDEHSAVLLNVVVTNPGVCNKSLGDVCSIVDKPFVVSRIRRAEGGEIISANDNPMIYKGDILRIVVEQDIRSFIVTFFGEEAQALQNLWETAVSNLVSKRILVSKPELNGAKLQSLNLRSLYNVNVTRLTRLGLDLVARGDLRLQLGDHLTIVGDSEHVEKVSKLFGDSLKRLDIPNLMPIFLGIFLGVILGSIPIFIPGISIPVKLGLAGGPLIVSILIGRFGPRFRLVTYSTNSANLMLREMGISLFLAAVGLGSGGNFIPSIIGGGYMWIIYGLAITMIPTLLMGIICRVAFHMDYFSIIGVMAGCCTNPPALAYAGNLSSNDQSSIAYATVYPVSMFMRVLCAQIMILISCF